MAIDIKVLHSGDDCILLNVAAEVFDNLSMPVNGNLNNEKPHAA